MTTAAVKPAPLQPCCTGKSKGFATPVASVPFEFESGPLSAAAPLQPLDGVAVPVGVGVGDGEGVGVGVGDGPPVGVGFGLGVGDGVGVLDPPLRFNAVESTKKFVTR